MLIVDWKFQKKLDMREKRQTRQEFSEEICDESHKLMVKANLVLDLVTSTKT